MAQKKCDESGYLGYRTGKLTDGRSVGGDDYNNTYSLSIGSCELKDEQKDKCASKKGQKYGDGTASAAVTGKENVDRLLSWPSGKPMYLCAEGCQVSGVFSLGFCEESYCPFAF